ncbi:MAG: hypothetical protein ACK5U4_05660 [Rhodospirillales bacterium]|jgi:hypothetical protein|nr:hypothetical protein [Magnetospirillum sp.]
MKKKSALPDGMSEYRLIFFRESEMVQAIGAFVRLQKKPLPVGMITRMVFDEGDFSMTLHMERDSGGKVERSFKQSEIAAALIGYCKNARIPLPRSGNKELRIISNRPAFLIREHGSGLDLDDALVDFRD